MESVHVKVNHIDIDQRIADSLVKKTFLREFESAIRLVIKT